MKIQVNIDRLVKSKNTSILAYVTVTLGETFAVHNVRVIQKNAGGLMVGMPSRSFVDKDGEKRYSDIVCPITLSARAQLEKAVIAAYERAAAAANKAAAQRGDQEQKTMPYGTRYHEQQTSFYSGEDDGSPFD